MLLRLFLLFTLIPAVEIWLLIEVGTVIGALNTLAIIVATGFLGAYYARRQGLRILLRIQESMRRGQVPGGELINGALLLVGGALLLTPGFLTDAVGFSLIFPPTRDGLKALLRAWLERKVETGDVQVWVSPLDPPGGPDARSPSDPAATPDPRTSSEPRTSSDPRLRGPGDPDESS